MGGWLVVIHVAGQGLCPTDPGGDLGILQGYLEMQFEKQTLWLGSAQLAEAMVPRHASAGRNEARCL